MTPNASKYNPDPQYMAELVESTGLSQGQLSELLGVDSRTIRRWLSGSRKFPYIAQFALESLVFEV
jgi:DNA-binding transcriptional regulator YiaG